MSSVQTVIATIGEAASKQADVQRLLDAAVNNLRNSVSPFESNPSRELLDEVFAAQTKAASLMDQLVALAHKVDNSVSSPRPSRVFHFSNSSFVTTAIVASKGTYQVNLVPDTQLKCVHSSLKQEDFFDAPIGAQPLLLPLMVTDGCSVVVEDKGVQVEECSSFGGLLIVQQQQQAQQQRPLGASMGFTAASLFSLMTKLLTALSAGVSRKAVFVARQSKRAMIGLFLSAFAPSSIAVVNLLEQQPPAPGESASRLVICSMAHVDAGMINTEDVDHMIVDGCGPQTATLFGRFAFRKLRDVVYRGPMSAVKKLPCPKASLFRARVWRFERSVNIFDVHLFSMAKETEELMKSFPAGRNILYTAVPLPSPPPAITVVTSLDELPEDVDHLVIADVPHTVGEIRQVLKKSAAHIITFLRTPANQKQVILDALVEEGITIPYGLRGLLPQSSNGTLQLDTRSEPSPSPSIPIRY